MRRRDLAWMLGGGFAVLAVVVLVLLPTPTDEHGSDAGAGRGPDGGDGPVLEGSGLGLRRPSSPQVVLPKDLGLRDLLLALADRSLAAQARERFGRLEDARAAAETLIEWMRERYDPERTVAGSGPMSGLHVSWIQYALVQIGPPALDALREALKDSETELRYRVVQAFSGFGKDAAVAASDLVERVRDGDEDRYTRALAIRVVVDSGAEAPELLSLVHAYLRSDETSEQVTSAAARALFRLGPPGEESFETARRVLDRHGVDACAEILASIGALGARAGPLVSFLVRLMDEVQEDGPVRRMTIDCLGRIARDDPQVVARLLAMVRDDQERLGQAAAHALARLGPKGREVLRSEAARSTGAEHAMQVLALVAAAAGFERGEPLTPEGVSILIDASDEESPQVRQQVALALERTPAESRPQAFDVLVRLSQDRVQEVRTLAWHSLVEVGRGRERELVPAATAALKEEGEWPLPMVQILGRAGGAASEALPLIEEVSARWGRSPQLAQASRHAIANIRAGIAPPDPK